MSLSSNISEKAALIWAIADKLTGVYKPHEYGEVILPLTVIRRFDCILADTKDAVLDKYESVKALPMKDILLRKASSHAFYNTGIATYIWVLSNKKAGTKREGKVQLINANGLFEKRRKALGNKRNDISESAIVEITQIYGDFCTNEISQVYNNGDFGYTKITVERPLRDENGELLLKKGKKQPDTALRDTENIPLTEDIKEYFKREVLPFAPDAWIDEKKSKVGYEIPFTRYFYKYEAPRPSTEIMKEIMELEKELDGALAEVFE